MSLIKKKKKTKIFVIIVIVSLFVSGYQKSEQKEQTTKKPNILFCIMDDASWQHMSAYGCDWVNTPNFDRLAERGILFNNTYTPNAKCAPSRASVLTGRNSWQLEDAANHVINFPAKFKTFPEALRENGYKTGFTGKPWEPGNPGEINGKKRLLVGTEFNSHKLKTPTKGISNKDYATNFNEFLNSLEKDQSWFFWYGAHEPHRRYEYGTGQKLAGKSVDDIKTVPDFWPDNDTIRNDMLDYALEIEYADKQLGKMMKNLEERNLLENTIILMTSDNGMPFPRCKAQEYEYSNHMPLAVMWPAGNPEIGYLDCDGSPTKTYILNLYRSGKDTTYWQWSFGKRQVNEEFFNITDDPFCMNNLISDNSYKRKIKKLKSVMNKNLKKQHDPRILGNGDVFDNYPFSEPKGRDYYERFMKGEFTPVSTGWVNPSDYEK